ncbi:hypothetical protein I8J29_30045 [Paenibacillus sp. MWE-103]|uniref:SH3 domain-containing protein n=1 Tax=Paenibacillus artemisiicola TaxID=1172618 RepID=A0ABS3WK22_9BACL|nr:hypothetical protein [Paenibacillus artemisiicola]MBO7748436.1 hypothetical protein [Paenibacillus artemisiicola]
MARAKAVRQTDLVLISWSQNPLVSRSPRRISALRVIGSSFPCSDRLTVGTPLRTALVCLLNADSGFKIVVWKQTSGISGYVLLQRKR